MSRRFLALVIVAAACSDAPTRSIEPTAARFSRLAAPTLQDRARLAELRAPWAWIGSLHHEAMQEVLHDPELASYTGRGPDSPACAAQIRYMKRYASRVAAYGAAPDTSAGFNALAVGVGVCTSAPGSTVLPPNAVGRYTAELNAALRGAHSYTEAVGTIDAVLLEAMHDATIGSDDLSQIAAVTVVAISSLDEWYGLAVQSTRANHTIGARALSETMTTVSADTDGCAAGSGSWLGCAIGAIGGSVLSW